MCTCLTVPHHTSTTTRLDRAVDMYLKMEEPKKWEEAYYYIVEGPTIKSIILHNDWRGHSPWVAGVGGSGWSYRLKGFSIQCFFFNVAIFVKPQSNAENIRKKYFWNHRQNVLCCPVFVTIAIAVGVYVSKEMLFTWNRRKTCGKWCFYCFKFRCQKQFWEFFYC